VFLGERGAEGEEFVAAGIAAQGRETEQAAHEGEEAGDMFRSNALQFGVAAVRAVGVEREAKRDGAGVEALFAGFAAPGENAAEAEEIVG